MKVLILEDDPQRQKYFAYWKLQNHQVTMANNVGEIISELEENEFDVLFLDHDLGWNTYVNSFGKEETGYLVALWLAENPDKQPGTIVLHTLNPVGRENMKAVLPKAHIVPFAWNYTLEQLFNRRDVTT